MRALIVEDDAIARGILKHFVGRFAQTTEAATGGEALKLHSTALEDCQGYRLVFLDIGLPDMRGTDVLRKMRQAELGYVKEPTRFVVISGEQELEAIREIVDAGADEYILKPLHGEQLILRLKNLGLPLRLAVSEAERNKMVQDLLMLSASDALPPVTLKMLVDRLQESIQRQQPVAQV